MTPEELAEGRRLVEAATRTPWRPERERDPVIGNFYFDQHCADGSTPIEATQGAALGLAVGVTFRPEDAALIVFLRNHAPALLAAEERATAAKRERDEAVTALKEALDLCEQGRQNLGGLSLWFDGLRAWEDRTRAMLDRLEAKP